MIYLWSPMTTSTAMLLSRILVLSLSVEKNIPLAGYGTEHYSPCGFSRGVSWNKITGGIELQEQRGRWYGSGTTYNPTACPGESAPLVGFAKPSETSCATAKPLSHSATQIVRVPGFCVPVPAHPYRPPTAGALATIGQYPHSEGLVDAPAQRHLQEGTDEEVLHTQHLFVSALLEVALAGALASPAEWGSGPIVASAPADRWTIRVSRYGNADKGLALSE